MRISKLINVIKYNLLLNENNETEIDELFFDSKKKVENGLYFCLTGGKQDGHLYAGEAVENGAVALVVEKPLPIFIPQIVVKDAREAMGIIASAFYGCPSERLKVIGITGTNGKTTTAHMLASIFEANGDKAGIIGTLGAKYGDVFIKTALTTPDPIEYNRILSEMLVNGVKYVITEISAHALYYNKTSGIRFCACIFTNLTQDHLDFFSSMEEYKKAKAKLFLDDVCPIAILNGDDLCGREFGKERNCKSVYYGLNTPAEAFAVIASESLYASECLLNINDVLCPVRLHMLGKHNVYNALGAGACALALGVKLCSISKGLTKIKGVTGRLERVSSYRGGEIFVDFAHTPDGLEKSLITLKEHCQGRLFCLFGCGGNRDKTKRPIMGETVAKHCDFALLTSDNPRYEDPMDILAEIEKGYRKYSTKYIIIPDRARAIAYALERLKEGDILLVAGKGGEEYQEIMGIKYPFKDNDIIKKIIDGEIL